MSDAGSLLNSTPQHHDRIILHVDNDCFYAACERLREPALEGEPVVVGMGYDEESPSGAVATASYEARRHGIESAQPISEAVDRLPPRGQLDDPCEEATAHYRPVDMAYYQEIAAEVTAILGEYADIMREVSIDEAYLDCSERTSWSSAEAFGQQIKDRIGTDVGLPTSVGIGPSMSVAKIASDHDKPDGLVVIEPDEVESFLHPLPVNDLHGVGPVTADVLREADLETIGDVAEADPGHLIDRFGERGRELHQRSRGIDTREVRPRGDPKSLSRESSFEAPVEDPDRVFQRVRELGCAVAKRADEQGATYRTIGIKVVVPPYEVNTRERSLSGPVGDQELVTNVATELLAEFRSVPIRKVGVRVSNLSFTEGEQPPLDTWADVSMPECPPETTSRESVLHRRGQTTLSVFSNPGTRDTNE